jgi:hypothetical protein
MPSRLLAYPSLIMVGEKDVENRTWTRGYRGPLAIHAGQRVDRGLQPWQRKIVQRIDTFPRGAIIGLVDLRDIVRDSRSRWAEPDHYHWVLTNPRGIEPVPMRGRLGLWTPDVEIPIYRPSHRSKAAPLRVIVSSPLDRELGAVGRERSSRKRRGCRSRAGPAPDLCEEHNSAAVYDHVHRDRGGSRDWRDAAPAPRGRRRPALAVRRARLSFGRSASSIEPAGGRAIVGCWLTSPASALRLV